MPGQFSDHNAVSVISRHGAGVNRAPTAEPPANFKNVSAGGFHERLYLWQSRQLCSSPCWRWQATQSSIFMPCAACRLGGLPQMSRE